MRVLLFLLLLCAGMVQAQNTNIVIKADECPKVFFSQETIVEYVEDADGALIPIVTSDLNRCDTIPVWVIYMDSVRLYAADPEFDMRIEIAPGWRINHRWGNQEWVDQDGRKFNPDNVILDKPRKPRRNPFKE